jgi:hypothetical protein
MQQLIAAGAILLSGLFGSTGLAVEANRAAPPEARFKIAPKLPARIAYLSFGSVKIIHTWETNLMAPAIDQIAEGKDPQEKELGRWLRAATMLWVYSQSQALRAKLDQVTTRTASPSALPGLITRYLYLEDEKSLAAAKRLSLHSDDLESLILLYRITGEAGYLERANNIMEIERGSSGWIARFLAREEVGNVRRLLERVNGVITYARVVGDDKLLELTRALWLTLQASPFKGGGEFEWLRLNVALFSVLNEQCYADEISRSLQTAVAETNRTLDTVEIAALAPTLVCARYDYFEHPLYRDDLIFIAPTDCDVRALVAEGEVEFSERVHGGTTAIELINLTPPWLANAPTPKPVPRFGFGLRIPSSPGATPTRVRITRLLGEQPGVYEVPNKSGKWGIIVGIRPWKLGDKIEISSEVDNGEAPLTSVSQSRNENPIQRVSTFQIPKAIAELAQDPMPGINLGQVSPPGFWGELLGVDPVTRTLIVRRDRYFSGSRVSATTLQTAIKDDEVQFIRVLPYAQVLRYGGHGVPLEYFQPGEKILVGLPPEGKGHYAVLVRDEVNIMYQHNHCYRIEALNLEQGVVTALNFAGNENVIFPGGRQTLIASAPGSALVWRLTPHTTFFRGGAKTPLAELHPGEMVQIKSHITGSENDLIAWEIIDRASMPEIDKRQRTEIDKYVFEGGVPVYVASSETASSQLGVLRGFDDYVTDWKPGDFLQCFPDGKSSPGVVVTLVSRSQDGPMVKLGIEGNAAAVPKLPATHPFGVQKVNGGNSQRERALAPVSNK